MIYTIEPDWNKYGYNAYALWYLLIMSFEYHEPLTFAFDLNVIPRLIYRKSKVKAGIITYRFVGWRTKGMVGVTGCHKFVTDCL